ncbi:MMPL family transporter [Corynebacterium tapiri]|uniref:MMPL family transporter n=1 Tax=Corynebacterium tapiri TaxID=1448266 RepID=A0A5C4U6Q9_9CORY|nr:MMPL family transporter [Corynebacterium tapiri]TNM00459.1 MMPL family transporter [Corynebacterium tapiri]
MSTFLYRLGRLAYRRSWPFIAAWILVLAVVGGFSAAFATSPASSFSIPGLPAVETQDRMKELFPSAEDSVSAPSGSIVIRANEGTLRDPEVQHEVQAMLDEVKQTGALKNPDSIVDPATAAAGIEMKMRPQLEAQGMPPEEIAKDLASASPLSEDAKTGTVAVTFDAPTAQDVTTEQRQAVTDVLQNDHHHIQVAYNGNGFKDMAGPGGSSELIGLAVAAIVLLIAFGSLVAAGMPIISALIGVGLGSMGIMLTTAFTDQVTDMTPTLAVMIGLAVGIDYSLFIVARFRTELVRITNSQDLGPQEFSERVRSTDKQTRSHAMGLAAGTAGGSVVFAGLTVIIALAALSIINIPFLTAMALAAAGTVVIAVLVALTFLPALLGLWGKRAFSGRIPGPQVPDPENEKPTMGLRWVRRIRQHPALHLVAGVILLALLAIPAAHMRLAMPTDASEAPGTPARTAHEMVADGFGPGRTAPMIALVEMPDVPAQERPAVTAQAVHDFEAVEGVVNAQVVAMNDDSTAAQVLITPSTDAVDEATSNALQELRNNEAQFHDATGATYGITGATAVFDDMSDRLQDVLIPYIAIVLVLAFIVLMVVFRSIWVPLIAALGFGLSVAATFGVTVALFQEGWLGLISDPQPLISFLPIMLIGLVFGLAMDYQVFLVTRMREGYFHGKTAGNATANGFKHGARVVTSAALIMIAVFAAFIAQDMPFIRTMGFALASAVAIDAFIVRMTIIPATMYLLGDRAWAFPRFLQRIVPKVDIEGEKLAKEVPTT